MNTDLNELVYIFFPTGSIEPRNIRPTIIENGLKVRVELYWSGTIIRNIQNIVQNDLVQVAMRKEFKRLYRAQNAHWGGKLKTVIEIPLPFQCDQRFYPEQYVEHDFNAQGYRLFLGENEDGCDVNIFQMCLCKTKDNYAASENNVRVVRIDGRKSRNQSKHFSPFSPSPTKSSSSPVKQNQKSPNHMNKELHQKLSKTLRDLQISNAQRKKMAQFQDSASTSASTSATTSPVRIKPEPFDDETAAQGLVITTPENLVKGIEEAHTIVPRAQLDYLIQHHSMTKKGSINSSEDSPDSGKFKRLQANSPIVEDVDEFDEEDIFLEKDDDGDVGMVESSMQYIKNLSPFKMQRTV